MLKQCIIQSGSFELEITRLFSHDNLSIVSDEEITQGLEDLSKVLIKIYDSNARIFDEAEPLKKFNSEYAIQNNPDNRTFIFLLAYLCLLFELSKRSNPCIHQRILVELIGRFTLLYADNRSLLFESCSKISTYFKVISELTLRLISSFTWSFDDAVYLRLTVMNLMYLQGLSNKKAVNAFLENVSMDSNDTTEYNRTIILECSEWYLAFISPKDIKQSLICIDTSWFYAYIFKKRFGFIYCRKITSTSILPYKYKMLAKSPCFRSLVPYEVGIGNSVQAVHLGTNRRSSEYRPTESSCLYNFSTMKYE